MTSDKTLAEIAEKIEKLGAMTVDNGATEAEAQAAAAMLAKLLTRYNLTIEEVASVSATKKPQSPVGVDYVANVKDRRFAWEEQLADAVAKGFYCRVLLQRGSLLFIGAERDRATAIAVFVRLRMLGGNLATEATKIYSAAMTEAGYSPRELRGSDSLKSFKLSFLLGFAHGLKAKLEELRRSERTDAAIGTKVTALVLVRDAAITEFIDVQWGKLGTARVKDQRYNHSAYKNGVETGRNQSIARADLTD